MGYGAVNQLVHRFLSGFDVRFIALRRDWSKQIEPTPTPLQRFLPVELPSFLQQTDRLIIALPATKHTVGLLGAKELSLLGKNALLVNVARGAIIEEKALFQALDNQQLSGAALDVWYNYQPQADSEGRKYPYTLPFHQLDNVLLSPHRAASPFSDLKRWDEVVENITRFATDTSPLLNVVDLEEEY